MLIPLSTSNSQYVLIFANGTDDSIIYSTEEISNADLYGFGNYSQPNTNKTATNTATFLGTTNILKKFVRFTAIIKYLTNSTLRYLDEIKVNATGKRDPKSIDFKNGIVKYHIIYNNTANMKNIIGIESLHDYKFSDDENNFPSTSAIITIIGYYINLMNTAQLENPIFIDFGREKPIIDETKYCEVNNQTIINKAKSFEVPGDLVATARNIYYFVRDDISYQKYSNSVKGAFRTLQEKCGNCCDQAHLLVALLRAEKIPTYYCHGIDHWWAVPCIDKQYHCDPTNKKHEFGNPVWGKQHRNPTMFNCLDH